MVTKKPYGYRKICENYRSISLLFTTGKLFINLLLDYLEIITVEGSCRNMDFHHLHGQLTWFFILDKCNNIIENNKTSILFATTAKSPLIPSHVFQCVSLSYVSAARCVHFSSREITWQNDRHHLSSKSTAWRLPHHWRIKTRVPC